MRKLRKIKFFLFLIIIAIGFERAIFLKLKNEQNFVSASPALIDASKDGSVFGDPKGLERVEELEKLLHQMQVRNDHPRIFITKKTLPIYQQRVKRNHPAWEKILNLADKGDMVNAAFAYLMLRDDNPTLARHYADIAIQKIKALNLTPWSKNKNWKERREIALASLAFDWVYDALSATEKKELAKKLGDLASIKDRAAKIRSGYKESGETFHREEWIFFSWRAWPEIALAHHYEDAEFCYKARWRYDWYWGDAARMYAYAGDGTPFEGYYCGADGCSWFLALKSATGINLVDDPRWPWCKQASYHLLYRLDFGRGREVFHHGVSIGAAGCISYTEGTVAWKLKACFGATFPLAKDDPYCQWMVKNISGVSSGLISNEYYGSIPNMGAIASILFYDPQALAKNPQTATWNELPYAIHFPGGNEVYMRSGWTGNSAMVGFRTSPAYTKTSHGDFDVNTFVIYRKGVLSPDSGVYDAYAGQKSYFGYQKKTVAHNDILVIDPQKPDYPDRGLSTPDPGGIERISTRTFSAPSRFGINDVFVHNPNTNWGDIIAFKTTPNYDYAVGEAAKAYGKRLNEYYRSLVFIRKKDKAYLIIFDRIEATKSTYEKRWLMHFVTEPRMLDGRRIKSIVSNHIETYDSSLVYGENVFGTSAVYLKSLLPRQKIIRKIGGAGGDISSAYLDPLPLTETSKITLTYTLPHINLKNSEVILLQSKNKFKIKVTKGYLYIESSSSSLTLNFKTYSTLGALVKKIKSTFPELNPELLAGFQFYVEGTAPRNYPITQKTIKRIEAQMGGSWKEIGQWRIEIIPTKKQKRDYFLSVIYIGDPNENIAPISMEEDKDKVAVIINDPEIVSNNKIIFPKTGNPTPIVASSKGKPQIVVKKQVSKSMIRKGEEVLYSLILENKGNGYAQNLILTDKLPSSLSFISVILGPRPEKVGSTLKWRISTLPPGRKVKVKFKVRVKK